MKLKARQVLTATEVLAQIINEKRPMPQRGKYLIARLHSKLLPEYNLLCERQTDMIKAYNTPQMRVQINPETDEKTETVVEGQWQVPLDKMPEYTEAWKTVADEEIEVDIQPIALQSLSLPSGSDGAIEASELITLGDLVFDSAA